MGYENQQIGWSQEAILMQKIIKQLVAINKTMGAVSAGTQGGPITTTAPAPPPPADTSTTTI